MTKDAISDWYTPNCTNTYFNKVIVGGDNTPAYTDLSKMLSLEIESIKSPSSFTTTKNFLIASYNSATMSYIDRTWGTASDDDLLKFSATKF